jgi:hypothetical protein
MKYVVIDLSSISERAALLTISDPNVKVFIPKVWYDSSIRQVKESRIKSRLLITLHYLLTEAKNKGTIKIVDVDKECDPQKYVKEGSDLQGIEARVGNHKVPGIALALYLKGKHPEAEVLVSTIDDDIERESRKCGLETMLPFATDKIFLIDAKRDSEMAKVARQFQRHQLIIITSPAIAAGLLAYFSVSIYKFLKDSVNVWFIIFALPLLGIFLYWFRSRQRLAYGISEFVFGCTSSEHF